MPQFVRFFIPTPKPLLRAGGVLVWGLIKIYINISAFLLFWSTILLCKSLRFNIRWKKELEAVKKKDEKVLFAVWHQATFVMFYLYRHQKACILVTPEIRGRILAKSAKWMGYQSITVPSTKEGFESGRSLVRMLRLIKKGCDAVIAVDGPSGPLFEVKPGAEYVSKKAGIPIIPLGVKAPWKISLFWRWDKYFIPLPFSEVRVRVGKPIWPDRKIKVDLKKKLKRLSQ